MAAARGKAKSAPLESHQFLLDQGCMVPRVLVALKRRFEVLNGFQTEGIFRVAGNDAECVRIAREIEKGKDAYCERSSNVHNYATLIKRFFAELPHKLLDKIPSDELIQHKEDFSTLDATLWVDEVHLSVYQWLLTVLLNTLRYSTENKMGINNLAIVWAPVLFDTAMSSSDLARGITVAEAQRLFIEDSIKKELGLSEEERAEQLLDRVREHTTSPRMSQLLHPELAESKEGATDTTKKKKTHQRKRSIGAGITKKLRGSASPGKLDLVLEDLQSQDEFYRKRVSSQQFTVDSFTPTGDTLEMIDAMALSPRGQTSTSVALSSSPTSGGLKTDYDRTRSADVPLRRNKTRSTPNRRNQRLSRTLSEKSFKGLLAPRADSGDEKPDGIGTCPASTTTTAKVGFALPDSLSSDEEETPDSGRSSTKASPRKKGKEKDKEKKKDKEKRKKEKEKRKKEKSDASGVPQRSESAENTFRLAFRGLLKGSSPSSGV